MTNDLTHSDELKIGIIGLGYVGLPLAVEFGKKFPTVGFDINPNRIAQIREGQDHTREVSEAELRESVNLTATADTADLKECTIFIVTVPTPIDSSKRPDLTPFGSRL